MRRLLDDWAIEERILTSETHILNKLKIQILYLFFLHSKVLTKL